MGSRGVGRRQGLLFLLSVVTASLLGVFPFGRAHAAFSICRTDPTVILTNGITVTMWSDIDTDLRNVQHVSYVLHVPHGLLARNVAFDSTRGLESVTVVADQTGNRYVVTELARATFTGIPMSVGATLSARNVTVVVPGSTGHALTISFRS